MTRSCFGVSDHSPKLVLLVQDWPRFGVDLLRRPQHSGMDRGHSSVLAVTRCRDQQILIHPDAQLRWQLHEPGKDPMPVHLAKSIDQWIAPVIADFLKLCLV